MGETDSWKNLKSKISFQTLLKKEPSVTEKKAYPLQLFSLPNLFAIGIKITLDWERAKQNINIRDAWLTLFVIGSRIFRTHFLFISLISPRVGNYIESETVAWDKERRSMLRWTCWGV